MKIKFLAEGTPRGHYPAVTRFFRLSLYCWVAISFLFVFADASMIWGSSVLFTRSGQFLSSVFLLGLFPGLHEYPQLLCLLPVALALLGLRWSSSRLLAFVICYVVMSLFDVARFSFDGGHNLASLLLIYNIFLDPRRDTNELSRFLSLSSLFTCRAQIVFLYLSASFAKIANPAWQDGEAIYFVLALDIFSLPWIQQVLTFMPAAFLKAASYFIVLFQLAFPVLVWNRRLRLGLLLCGSLIYVGIMYTMGLVTFGLMMMISHLLFLDDVDMERLSKLRLKFAGRVMR